VNGIQHGEFWSLSGTCDLYIDIYCFSNLHDSPRAQPALSRLLFHLPTVSLPFIISAKSAVLQSINAQPQPRRHQLPCHPHNHPTTMYLHPLWLVAVATVPITALPQAFTLDPSFATDNTETLEDVALFDDLPSSTEPLDAPPASTSRRDTETLTPSTTATAITTATTDVASAEQPFPSAPPLPHAPASTPEVSAPPVSTGRHAEQEHWPAWLPAVTFMLVFYDLATVVLFVWLWACGHLVWLRRERRGPGDERTGREMRGYEVVRGAGRAVGDRRREERQRWEREVRRMGLY
jgi:hypothetical protein